MIKNWGAALVVIFIFLGTLTLPRIGPFPNEHSPQAQGNAATSATRKNEPSDVIVFVRRIDRFLKRHNESFSAISSIVIALFTIILAWKTWGLHVATRGLQDLAAKQKDDMESSLKIAADAARASRDAADASMAAVGSDRAWMVFERPVIGRTSNSIIDGVDVIDGIALAIIWVNSGRSPAVKAKLFINHAIVDRNSQDLPNFSLPNDFAGAVSAPVGPNKTIQTDFRGIDDIGREAVFSRAKDIIVYSRVIYSGIFNLSQEYMSEICIRISANGTVSLTQNGEWQTKWDVSIAGKQNTAI